MTETSGVNGKFSVNVESEEIESLRAQVQSEHEMYLRALADFDNYRRRTERDTAISVERGTRGLIFSFLEVVDSFELALQHLGAASTPIVEGLQATYRKALAFLQAHGVTPYKSVGEKFDPALHEAVATVSGPDHPTGVVLDQLRQGYRLGDAVIRPALVRVSNHI